MYGFPPVRGQDQVPWVRERCHSFFLYHSKNTLWFPFIYLLPLILQDLKNVNKKVKLWKNKRKKGKNDGGTKSTCSGVRCLGFKSYLDVLNDWTSLCSFLSSFVNEKGEFKRIGNCNAAWHSKLHASSCINTYMARAVAYFLTTV